MQKREVHGARRVFNRSKSESENLFVALEIVTGSNHAHSAQKRQSEPLLAQAGAKQDKKI